MSKQLFVDTTNNYCVIAAYDNKKHLKTIKLQVNKNVTDIIVENIKYLLFYLKLKHDDIDKIYLNIGPGSFTGARVCSLIGKAWKIVRKDIEIYTINSLRLQMNKSSGISIIDAKSNKSYIAIYHDRKCVMKPQILSNNEVKIVIEKYNYLEIFDNLVDTMEKNFLFHIRDFCLVNDIDDIKPLYIKSPV